MKTLVGSTLTIAMALPLLASPAMAEEHRGDRGGHERHFRHDGGWRGDIRGFREHDFPRWRGGYWHRGRHDGRFGWWWIVAGMWYFYPRPIYPYPDPYVPYIPPAVVMQQPAPAAPPVGAAPQYWYYCQNPQGYYPYVAQCQVPWQVVPASPPPAP